MRMNFALSFEVTFRIAYHFEWDFLAHHLNLPMVFIRCGEISVNLPFESGRTQAGPKSMLLSVCTIIKILKNRGTYIVPRCALERQSQS